MSFNWSSCEQKNNNNNIFFILKKWIDSKTLKMKKCMKNWVRLSEWDWVILIKKPINELKKVKKINHIKEKWVSEWVSEWVSVPLGSARILFRTIVCLPRFSFGSNLFFCCLIDLSSFL
jgi:hypothetical protein